LCSQPPEAWSDRIDNAFEQVAANAFPQIKEVRSLLAKHGAKFVSMSGSGSAMYGIFHENDGLSRLEDEITDEMYYKILHL
jgi:4-diphosphocytidyl-2-C-methyl-D-erythritol kinase